MEKKRISKDGHIVVKNPLYQELPKHEVTIQSGRTVYRFTGSYDGERALPERCCGLWKRALHPAIRSSKMSTYNPVWQTARLKGENYDKAV